MMQDIGMILAPNNRTKAYLQLMIANKLLPNFCLIMARNKTEVAEEASRYTPKNIVTDFFNDQEPILNTLHNAKIPYSIYETTDINDPGIIRVLEGVNQKYIIYSGYGGQILKKPILSINKKFLHIHPGILPSFRGSTTIYYSLLEEGRCGVSAIFLTEKIDEGNVIAQKYFEIPSDVPDLDNIFDPYIRASLLVDVLKEYKATGKFHEEQQKQLKEETYFIIHPVLKHIAIFSEIESKRGSENG